MHPLSLSLVKTVFGWFTALQPTDPLSHRFVDRLALTPLLPLAFPIRTHTCISPLTWQSAYIPSLRIFLLHISTSSSRDTQNPRGKCIHTPSRPCESAARAKGIQLSRSFPDIYERQ